MDGLAARPVLPGPARPLGERRHPGKSLSGLLLRHRPGLRLLLHRLVRLMRCLPALRLLLVRLALLLLERLPRLGLLRRQELLGGQLL
ncbi:MAG TPA: hypothetical protein VGH57_27850 [Amycolatopsis sp.]